MYETDQTEDSFFSNALRLISRFMVPAALIAFSAPFLALLRYALPASDDFCKATLSFDSVPQSSVLAITWMYYTKWSPRWLTTLLQSSVMSHVNLVSGYGWLLLLVIASNVLALTYFFRTFFSFTRSRSFLIACVFYTAWVASLADPSETLYWLTGATEYFWSLTTLLLLVSLLYRSRRTPLHYAAIALLAIAVPAQHEIAGVLLCSILLFGVVATRVKGAFTGQWYVALGLATLSEAAAILSPGNAIRAAAEHRHLWDIAHLPKWTAYSLYNGMKWLSHPSFLLAALCIILLSQDGRKNDGPEVAPPKWLGVASICGMLLLLGEFTLVEVASGNWTPDRVLAWFEFVFWIFFICAILIGVPELRRLRFSPGVRVGVFTLLAAALLGSLNYRSVLLDLHGPAQTWYRIDSARLKQRGGVLEFEAPARFPKLLMNPNLTKDSGCWVNRCMANYLHADSVVEKDSTQECPH